MNAKAKATSHVTARGARRGALAAVLGTLAVGLGASSLGCGETASAPLPGEKQSQRSALIMGATGTTFNLTARSGRISTADGASVYTWGYALDNAVMQYPGPTLIVDQGAQITVNLQNELPLPVSIVFAGQQVNATGGSQGALTREAAAGETVSYTFTATHPGTYLYNSGTRPELQVEMGLVGALIVRPTLGAKYAYNDAATEFDREYLFLLTEMDPKIHELAEAGNFDGIDFSARWPVFWFINGRGAPDTMLHHGVPWLPHQPYGSMVRMHPGERVLMRMVNGGRDLHPFHHHGNHARLIAADGRLLQSAPAAGLDLSYELFTIKSVPGETADAIFGWTGEELGWDIYGDPSTHQCNDGDSDGFDDQSHEYCADHGKAVPVALPQQLNMTFGGHYSGSPFLGVTAALPPGEGGLNPNGAYPYMWHSHTEKEMTNDDIFPGGMMTMLFVEAPGVPIP